MASRLNGRLARLEGGARRSPATEERIDQLLTALNTPDADGSTVADELSEQFAGVALFPEATPHYRALAHLFRPNDTEETP